MQMRDRDEARQKDLRLLRVSNICILHFLDWKKGRELIEDEYN